MTDRQKLLAALVSEPEAGLSELEVATRLSRLRDTQRYDEPVSAEHGTATVAA